MGCCYLFSCLFPLRLRSDALPTQRAYTTTLAHIRDRWVLAGMIRVVSRMLSVNIMLLESAQGIGYRRKSCVTVTGRAKWQVQCGWMCAVHFWSSEWLFRLRPVRNNSGMTRCSYLFIHWMHQNQQPKSRKDDRGRCIYFKAAERNPNSGEES